MYVDTHGCFSGRERQRTVGLSTLNAIKYINLRCSRAGLLYRLPVLAVIIIISSIHRKKTSIASYKHGIMAVQLVKPTFACFAIGH